MSTPGASGPLVIPLVGAWHRPPARQILACLPSGARLVLQAATSAMQYATMPSTGFIMR